MRPTVKEVYAQSVARIDKTIYSGKSKHASYDIVEMVYDNRPARVLFSGDKIAAQSGIALDNNSDLLFDYNQRFMEVIASLKPAKILLIGGGVLTLPMALLGAYPKMKIDVVELDDCLEELAERYFNFQRNPNIRIFIEDGRHYIDYTDEVYDLILIDAFNYTEIPKSLTTKAAIAKYAERLSPKGNSAVAINIISAYYGRNAEIIQQQYERYAEQFKSVEVFPASRSLQSFWIPQNFVLVAQPNKKKALTLRYDSLEPPTGLPATRLSVSS